MSLQIAAFRLNNRLFGLDILLVKEVHRQMAINPVPGAPPHLAGLMNLRGRVVTVIDPGVSLGLSQAGDRGGNALLILKTDEEIQPFIRAGSLARIELGEDIVGLLIDGMEDVWFVEASEVLSPPSHLTDTERELIYGVVKRGDDLVMLLELTSFLNRVMDAIHG